MSGNENPVLPEGAAPAQAVRGAFWADDPRCVRLVARGAVDLFLQRRTESGAPTGPRQHVFRALPGQAFFGMGAANLPGGHALIAVPLPGTALQTADIDWLQRNGPADEVVRLCEDWVSATARGMQKPPAPRQSALVAPGTSLELPADETLRAPERVTWIEVIDGNGLWMERYDSVANAASGPVPLPRDLWLKAAGRLVVREVSAADLLRDGRLWRALAVHQRFVLGWLIASAEQAIASEQSRLEAKAQRSLILTQEALQRLLSVATDQEATVLAQQAKHDVCLAACRALGERMGIEFRMPHPAELAAMDRNPVAAIAAASGVRFRRTALKGDWWTGDNGPLLANFAEGGEWVALLPRRDGYDAFTPATGETVPVTEDFAARLNPFATMFYRALPGKALRLADIAAFAVRGRGADLALVLAMGVLGGLLAMAMPVATGALVDTLIPSADVTAIWQLVAALAAATVAATLFEVSRSIAVLRIEGKMDSDLQSAVWDRVLRLPVPFFRKFSAGDLALRINGVNSIRRALSRTTVGALLTGVFSVFSYLLLFHYSVGLAVVATLLVLAAMAVTLTVGLVKLRYERRLSEVGGKLSSLVFQYLSGIVKLRVGSAESRAFANWAERFAHYRSLQFRAQHWGNIEHTILSGYTTIAAAVLFAVMGTFIAGSPAARMSTGDFIAFSAAFGTFFAGMVSLAETLLGVLNLVPVYERARPVLETLPEADAHKAHPGELQGGIEVSKLSFRYGDGPEILEDVSFSVRAGGFVALVGPSGSGKSTLLRLLLGFETPASGSIYYDSQDLASVDVQALRRQLGVVLQNGQLIAGDIFTNVVGSSELGIDDAWEAARMVGLEDDINQMPMGMHTVIGEGASTLSGGQRQRILIARAIVHRPRILFFDEATSALDNRTQAIVTRSLDRLKSTRIVIAHRLSTIINADRIIVLQDGEIAQVGNYDTLIAQPGPFAELAKRQIA